MRGRKLLLPAIGRKTLRDQPHENNSDDFGILFGTWTWTNVTLGGAWQLALGFALVGELGAIYFTVYNRKPLVAGAFSHWPSETGLKFF